MQGSHSSCTPHPKARPHLDFPWLSVCATSQHRNIATSHSPSPVSSRRQQLRRRRPNDRQAHRRTQATRLSCVKTPKIPGEVIQARGRTSKTDSTDNRKITVRAHGPRGAADGSDRAPTSKCADGRGRAPRTTVKPRVVGRGGARLTGGLREGTAATEPPEDQRPSSRRAPATTERVEGRQLAPGQRRDSAP